MMCLYGIIYVTVNKANGKKYIGQHKCSKENDSYLGSGKILKDAIEKYGKENFERYTLYRAETKEELDKKEIEFIAVLNATHRPDYYNINEGGNANRMCGENNPMYGHSGPLAPAYGKKLPPEEIEKRRQRMLGENNPMFGTHLSEERKKQISENQSGEKHWNYGRHWSEETKAKMSAAKKGKPNKIKGTKRSQEFCDKLSKAKTGKHPKLSEEVRKKKSELITERNQTNIFKQQISEANRRYHESGGRRGAKPVLCIETNIVYASGYDACRALNCSKGLIAACLCGSQKTAKGYHWRYATQEEAVRAVVA